ncbi:hypothetical protein QTP81_13900 [Alteromonas sp. ASW11-36]|uniref:Transglutaminase domain-containing protein n=1 Tax=Alteromonas arenosi TaxID=3055817 RepID=A0ABT7SZW9_9ALTE|nr:hypothetical protein [Alteromonas sp. ASW11-36]MDM7861690.1 hypothetical protein [Alteromonas sp. ASW11-36]
MRRNTIKQGLVASLALFASFALYAQQQSFSRNATQDGVAYAYAWLDQDRQSQDLSFTLEQSAIARLPTTQRSYQPSVAQRHVVVSLFHHARTYDPKQVRIDIKPNGELIDISVSSRFPEKIAEYQQAMRAHEQQAYDEYLYKNYYERYQTRLNQNAIKPDHLRYIDESTRALIPLSQAIYEKLNRDSDAREYINLMLGWLQSIPYSTLTDRVSTNGSGFLPPITLLNQNIGDCDSKTVLAAAIIRAFLPKVPMRMVFLRNHALLAISLTAGNEDQRIMIEGLPYILMEPTGPSLMPLGEIGQQSLLAIQQGQYTTQSIQAAITQQVN